MDKDDFHRMVDEAYDIHNTLSSGSSSAELGFWRDRLAEILQTVQYGSFLSLGGGSVSMGERNHAARKIEEYISDVESWMSQKSCAPGAHMVYR